jgi:hypothetical protein
MEMNGGWVLFPLTSDDGLPLRMRDGRGCVSGFDGHYANGVMAIRLGHCAVATSSIS